LKEGIHKHSNNIVDYVTGQVPKELTQLMEVLVNGEKDNHSRDNE
jgi:hypothetical protein